jgi:hypothetical protein
MIKVTGEEVRQAAINAGVDAIPASKCSICEESTHYIVQRGNLFFDGACGCVDSGMIDPISWEVAARFINSLEGEGQGIVLEAFGFALKEETEPFHLDDAEPESGKIPFEWEQIDDWHQRTKVFGGWIVKTHESVFHANTDGAGSSGDGWDWRISTCFVPDVKWEWEV